MRQRYPTGTIERARRLRRDATEYEKRVWCKLREAKRMSLRFRRQAPFRNFVLDFVEHGARLVVELAGGQHADVVHTQHDRIRDSILRREGYRVLRFWNTDVHEDLDGVVVRILQAAALSPTRTTSPSDLPTRGRLP